MIYTTYFGKLKKLPKEIVPISICGKAPEWWTGLQYKTLAPKYNFFMEWTKNKDNDYYIEHFNKEVLNVLDADKVVFELNEMVNGRFEDVDIALVCYEKPEDFCHRHLVANWLIANGYDCMEWSEN